METRPLGWVWGPCRSRRAPLCGTSWPQHVWGYDRSEHMSRGFIIAHQKDKCVDTWHALGYYLHVSDKAHSNDLNDSWGLTPDLGFALSSEACAEGIQRLAGDGGGAGGQTTADEMHCWGLAVIARLLMDQLCQGFETRKLGRTRQEKPCICNIVYNCVKDDH